VREELPEVTRLRDARGERPGDAAAVGDFWYEPGVWALPLSPAARVLYAGLCSFLGPGEIHRKDLRNTLKGSSDAEIARAFEELVGAGLLAPLRGAGEAGYEVRAVGQFEGGRATT
jgi:hypothetical protein